MSRLMLKVAAALSRMQEQPKDAIMLMYSTCTISFLEENAKRLKPYFHNRRGEILENMDEIRKFVALKDIHFVPGELKPADIPTRGDSKLEYIGPNSIWQTGPQYLSLPRDKWPITRDFIREPIRDEEKRHMKAIASTAFRTVIIFNNSQSLN